MEESTENSKRTKRRYTVDFKLNVIKYSEQASGRATARHFKVDTKLVRTWKKQKADLEKLANTGQQNQICKIRKKKRTAVATEETPTDKLLSPSDLCGGDFCANCRIHLEHDKVTNFKTDEPFMEEDIFVSVESAIATVFEICWSDFLKSEKVPQKRNSRTNTDVTELQVVLCKSCALLLQDIYSAYCRFEQSSNLNSLIKRAKGCRQVNTREKVEKELRSASPEDLFDDFNFDDEQSQFDEEGDREEKVKFTPPDESNGDTPDVTRLKSPPMDSDQEIYSEEETSEEELPVKKSKRISVKKTKEKIKKEYKCNVCSEIFPVKEQLRVHSKIHKEEKPITKSEERSGPYPCKFCGKLFKNRDSIRSHERIHSTEKVTCEKCGKLMRNKKCLKVHLERVHISEEEREKLKICCELCGKSLFAETLKTHMSLIHGEHTKLNCPMCEKTFSSEERLRFHLEAHSSTTVYPCSDCGRSFPIEQYLKEHIENYHKKQKPFGCKQCLRRFVSQKKADIHSLIHSAEKSFSCDECGKLFSTLNHLKQHIRCHADEALGPFNCADCEKSFKNTLCLRAHRIRSHRTDLVAGKRIFICNICGKSLYDERNLKKHREAVHKEYTEQQQ